MDALATAATTIANNNNNNNNNNSNNDNSNIIPITTTHNKTAEEILKEKRRKNKLCQQRHRERKTALATAASAAALVSPSSLFTTPLISTQHLPFASFLSSPFASSSSSSSSSSFALASGANTNANAVTGTVVGAAMNAGEIQEQLKSKGYFITPFNPLLYAYIEGFKCINTNPESKLFEYDHLLYGGQHQYSFGKKKEKVINFGKSIQPFLTQELNIVEQYFKIKKQHYQLTDIKFTTNRNPESSLDSEDEFVECLEQGPHVDVFTDQVLFVSIPVSGLVVATRIYGTVKEMLEFHDENQINKFFNIKNKSLVQGQCLIFLPSFVHAAPKLPNIERNLLYLEYSAITVAAEEYDQTFIHEFKGNKIFKAAIRKLEIQRKWMKPDVTNNQGKYHGSYNEDNNNNNNNNNNNGDGYDYGHSNNGDDNDNDDNDYDYDDNDQEDERSNDQEDNDQEDNDQEDERSDDQSSLSEPLNKHQRLNGGNTDKPGKKKGGRGMNVNKPQTSRNTSEYSYYE